MARLVVGDFAAAPCCVVAACVRRGGRWSAALGVDGALWPAGPPAGPSTLFDLASVTKPAVALAAARLDARRPLLSTPLGELLDEARGTPSEAVPIELLLAHRAGLDAHRPLYAPLQRGEPVDRAAALREAALARRADCAGAPPPGGFAPLYSDLGYLLAGAAVERAAGEPLDRLIERDVAAFSGGPLRSARELRDLGLLDATAPTEHAEWRGGVVRGQVHDENAWALGGLGVCGHAGLFGTAADLARLGALLIEALDDLHPGWLSASQLAPLLSPRPGGTLRAGFDSKSAAGSSAGSRFGPRSFGHLGFTGTSLWIDPDQSLAVALLTNRVHPTRAHDAIKRARPAAHDAIAAWAEDPANSSQKTT